MGSDRVKSLQSKQMTSEMDTSPSSDSRDQIEQFNPLFPMTTHYSMSAELSLITPIGAEEIKGFLELHEGSLDDFLKAMRFKLESLVISRTHTS